MDYFQVMWSGTNTKALQGPYRVSTAVFNKASSLHHRHLLLQGMLQGQMMGCTAWIEASTMIHNSLQDSSGKAVTNYSPSFESKASQTL